MSQPNRLLQANPPDILPRPDLPHPKLWYWNKGRPLPLQELHPNALASYQYDMDRAQKYWKMAWLCRDHRDADIRWFYPRWAGEAEHAYEQARFTRDFGAYGHTLYEK